MNSQQPSRTRVAVMLLFAAAAVRTAWINATLSAEFDGTPILAFTLIFLIPMSVLAVIFLVVDSKQLKREPTLGRRRLTSLLCEIVGVGATLTTLFQ